MTSVQKKRQRSESLLKGIAALKVKLESGQEVELSLSAELAIPDGPDELVNAARHGAERYAFWAYQYERALGRLRAEESKLVTVEGTWGQIWRKNIMENTEWDVTEKAVEEGKGIQPEVRDARITVNAVRKEAGILRAVKDAMNHRCFALDRLVARQAEVSRG